MGAAAIVAILAGRRAAQIQRETARRRREMEEKEARKRRERERERRENVERRRREEKEREQQHNREKVKKVYHREAGGKLQRFYKQLAEQQGIVEFTTELSVKYKDLPIVHDGAYESILADGSKLSDMGGKFVRTYPDGRVQEYNGNTYYGSERVLELTKEELPNGAMVVYKDGKKVYETDAQGNYTYQKTDSNGKIIENVEGKVSSETSQEFTTELSIKYADLPIVHRGAYESILADGSKLSGMDGKFVRTYPDGRVQEYSGNTYYGSERVLELTKEELPNGAMVVYKDGKKVYERDAQGNYTYQKTDSNGKIIETVEGKVSSETSQEFTTELSVKYKDLPIVHHGAYESILADGSKLSGMDGKFVRTYPDGRVQEYNGNTYYGSERVLELTKEELPNGAIVVYEKGKKVYETDGKTPDTPSTEFTTELSVKYKDLPIVHDGAYESILADGSKLSGMGGKFVRTYPDSKVQEYSGNTYYGSERVLELTKEELPNGELVIYKDGKIVYERDADGNFTYHKTDSKGKKTEKIESKNGVLKKTYYDYYEQPRYYTVSNEPNKKYHPSGKLYEEKTDKGECFRYAENGTCLYERNEQGEYTSYQLAPNGKDRLVVEKGVNDVWNEMYEYYPSGAIKQENTGGRKGQTRRYDENGVCLYEEDKEGCYREYQLTPDGKDRLMVISVEDYYIKEQYEYYPSGAIKRESTGGSKGQTRMYAENGICLYEKDGEGCYRKYQLTPDGKDRLLTARYNESGKLVEEHSYYASGRVKESKLEDGTYIKYNEDGNYQKYDKDNRLKEETSRSGKTTYTYYQGTDKVEHIHKYDIEGNDISSEYKHFDKEGTENTAYYMAMKRIIAQKIEKADKKQAEKGIPQEERKADKKMSKAAKLFAHLKAKRESQKA